MALCVASGASLGCRRRGVGALPPAPPPLEAYAPGEWKSFKGEAFHPPEAALQPWRVMMLQEMPRPKKNPHWKAIPVQEGGLLEMPKESRFRCLYNPATFRPWGDEHMKAVEKWDVLRTVRCSSDGWHTFSQAAHALTMSPDGASVGKSAEQAELYLSETVHGKPLQITIVLRADSSAPAPSTN